ncbi:DUF4148 domain-containing protein, partial [Hydrogenophaga electricum]|uniref:DUF4148 domain-containing protein n=1 Tax=Hydrogenophaga electricum TaxID=1230953 RepID=UPI0024E0F8E2
MNTQRRFTSVFAAAVLAIAAGQAVAADQGLSREQVQAELQQAIRDGSLVAGGDSGQTLAELSPNRYPAVQAQGLSREQVKAQLQQALRDGSLVAGGDSGQTLAELSPAQYAAKADVVKVQAAAPEQGKTRAEVKAELREALRTGDIVADGDSGMKLNELFPGHYRNVQ